ncbi:hypothetical protein D3C76_295990 [compost metagenome]
MTVIPQLDRLRAEQWRLCQIKRTYESFHQTGEFLFKPIHSFKSNRRLNFYFLQHLAIYIMKGGTKRLVSANERLKCLLHAIQINISGQAQGSRNIVCSTDTTELLLHIDPTLRTSDRIIGAILRLAD